MVGKSGNPARVEYIANKKAIEELSLQGVSGRKIKDQLGLSMSNAQLARLLKQFKNPTLNTQTKKHSQVVAPQAKPQTPAPLSPKAKEPAAHIDLPVPRPFESNPPPDKPSSLVKATVKEIWDGFGEDDTTQEGKD